MSRVMPPRPRVSVCTITHNRRPLLPLLASCLLAQDYPLQRLQWVIVDDSSVGERPDLEPARRAGITVLWRELPERLPIGAKRNLANDLASGELIVVMDDDDYYPPSRISHAVQRLLSADAPVAGCDRLPLLLLPEQSAWLTPPFSDRIATANALAYRRSFLEAGHRFDPAAEQAEEPAFLADADGRLAPLVQLDPFQTVVCINHGGNTVDKRTWMAVQAGQGFERLSAQGRGFPEPEWLQRYRAALGLPPAAEIDASGAGRASPSWRVAVVTPYHNEDLNVLRRCHDSVLAQTVPCVHLLVADGPLRPEVMTLEGRHILLGVGHSDNGNTPRSLGALAAMNEAFTCIAFLDADNWFRPDHLETAIATQAEGDFDVVFSDRQIVFPDGQRLLTPPAEDRDRSHVDTSCMVVFGPAFASLALWAQMPRAYAPMCDRVMFHELIARYRCGWSQSPTLVFETWYSGHFLAAGMVPPLNAKFLDCRPRSDWEAAAAAGRQRSLTAIHAGPLPLSPAKTSLELITIHAPACSGGTLLQWLLCHHLGYVGIPENQFLFQFIARFGADHRRRYSGAEIIDGFADALPEQPLLKAHDRHAIDLTDCLQPERSFTLMEAYFRLIQRRMPPNVRDLSQRLGSVFLLDRSCTLALAAETLFQCLPLHRALLVLRDPLDVMAAMAERRQRWPEAWAMLDGAPRACAELILRTVPGSLAAAPQGRLHLVLHRALVDQPRQVVAAVAGFLGMAPNPVGAMEPMPRQQELACNHRYDQELQRMVAAIPDQILDQEPWKTLNRFASPEPRCAGFDPAAPELIQLRSVLAPLRQRLGCLDAQAAAGQPDLQPEGDWQTLQELVQVVMEGLDRHGLAAWEPQPR